MREWKLDLCSSQCGTFRTLGVPYFGVLIIRILLSRVLYQGPLFSETPMCYVQKDCGLQPSALHKEILETTG